MVRDPDNIVLFSDPSQVAGNPALASRETPSTQVPGRNRGEAEGDAAVDRRGVHRDRRRPLFIRYRVWMTF
eukprot:3952948-Prymnesium_polylepis.1